MTATAIATAWAKAGFVPLVNDLDLVLADGDNPLGAASGFIHLERGDIALLAGGKLQGVYGGTVALAESTLDGLPGTDEARRRTWLCLSTAPGFDYYGEWFELDRGVMGAIRQSFIALQDLGYEPPIVQAHVDEGPRWGDILDVRPWQDPSDGVLKLCAHVQWTEKAWVGIKAGEYRYISPHYGRVHDSQGNEWPLGLREVTLTSQPYQKHIGDIQSWARRGGIQMSKVMNLLSGGGASLNDNEDTGQEAGSGAEGQGADGGEDKLDKILTAVTGVAEKVTAMDARVTALENKGKDDEDEGEEGGGSEEGASAEGEGEGEEVAAAASDNPVIKQILAENKRLAKRQAALEAQLSEQQNAGKRASLAGKVIVLSEAALKKLEGKVGIDTLAELATDAPKAQLSEAAARAGRHLSRRVTPAGGGDANPPKPTVPDADTLAKMSEDAVFHLAEEIALSEKRDIAVVFSELQIKAGRQLPR